MTQELTADSISLLLDEAIDLIPGLVEASTDAQGGVVLLFEAAPAVELQLLAHTPGLVLAAVLGSPTAARRVEVMESLMSYTALWQDNGGVKAALGGPGGDFMLAWEPRERPVTPRVLAGWIVQFSELAQWWAGYVALDDAQPAAPGVAMPMGALA